jgi:hypothetical protein
MAGFAKTPWIVVFFEIFEAFVIDGVARRDRDAL